LNYSIPFFYISKVYSPQPRVVILPICCLDGLSSLIAEKALEYAFKYTGKAPDIRKNSGWPGKWRPL